MRLHAFSRRTFENVLGFSYGMTRDDYMEQERIYNLSRTDNSFKVHRKEPIWDYYKEQGYVTGFTTNMCDS